MLDNKEISSFCSGEEFIGFYALKKFELKESDGSYRIELELSDKTGTIQAVIWDEPILMKEILKKGAVVKVKGCIQTYREKLQVKINKIRLATPD